MPQSLHCIAHLSAAFLTCKIFYCKINVSEKQGGVTECFCRLIQLLISRKELFMNKIITIGREFGSGGRELGRRLSDSLGYAYYDQEIISEIAKRTELSEEYIKQITENCPTHAYPIHIGISFYHADNPVFNQSINIYAEQHKLLQELAAKSDCVIVGRCADYILQDKNPLRIFVYADTLSKVERCIEREADGERLSEHEIKKKISAIDKKRAKYYEFFSHNKWGSRENYDLMVNTGGKDIKTVSEAVLNYIKTLR